MAIVDEKKLQEDFSKKKLRSFYYFYGEELYKIDEAVGHIKKLLLKEVGENFQWETMFGDEVKAENLCDASDSFSLWQSRKGILVKNAEAIPAKQWERLKRLVENPNETTTLVFCASKADLRTKHIQWISKATDHAILVEFSAPEAWEAQQYLKKFVQAQGRELDPAAQQLLLEWSGHSLFELEQSIEKASLFSLGKKNISEEDIRAVQVRTRPESIFQFADALLSGNRASAMQELSKILEQGEDPIAILGLVARQYRWLLQILALRAEGKNESLIASELRLFPRQAKQLWQAAQKQGAPTVIRGLARIVEADKGLKSTREPAKMILERLSLSLVSGV